MTKTVDENYIWKIIGNFFKKKGLVYQQIEHFNHYINRGIQEVINEEDNISIPTEKGCRIRNQVWVQFISILLVL